MKPSRSLSVMALVLIAMLPVAASSTHVTRGSAKAYAVLYNFQGNRDGAVPLGGVIRDSKGNLYGTTYENLVGSVEDFGVVFKLDPRGKESVLHTFRGRGHLDGGNPHAGLTTDAAGNLYGTTFFFGSRTGCGPARAAERVRVLHHR